MIKRTGIVISADKVGEFEKAAAENAKKHNKEYWKKSYELTSRKIDMDRVDRLCGYKKVIL